MRLIIFLFLVISLSSCAVYKSAFSCGDAKGAACRSMDKIDNMISSGEIERFNEAEYREVTECKNAANCRLKSK